MLSLDRTEKTKPNFNQTEELSFLTEPKKNIDRVALVKTWAQVSALSQVNEQ